MKMNSLLFIGTNNRKKLEEFCNKYYLEINHEFSPKEYTVMIKNIKNCIITLLDEDPSRYDKLKCDKMPEYINKYAHLDGGYGFFDVNERKDNANKKFKRNILNVIFDIIKIDFFNIHYDSEMQYKYINVRVVDKDKLNILQEICKKYHLNITHKIGKLYANEHLPSMMMIAVEDYQKTANSLIEEDSTRYELIKSDDMPEYMNKWTHMDSGYGFFDTVNEKSVHDFREELMDILEEKFLELGIEISTKSFYYIGIYYERYYGINRGKNVSDVVNGVCNKYKLMRYDNCAGICKLGIKTLKATANALIEEDPSLYDRLSKCNYMPDYMKNRNFLGNDYGFFDVEN
jgi:hypothetical protein